jgi:hypothetical protein
VDGSVYKDLPVGLCDACACQPEAFFGALHIFFCIGGRHMNPSLVDMDKILVGPL